MSFNSLSFALLFATALILRATVGRTKLSPLYLQGLLLASLIFYGWHIPYYVGILLFSCVVDFWAGARLGRPELSGAQRKLILLASLVTNLGLLGVFKYYNFFTAELTHFLGMFDITVPLPVSRLILPMGISFYTFQSMSYTIDVYRGKVAPEKRFWPFLLYVSFFPQLTAGPIVRAKQFLYQIPRRRRIHPRVWAEGSYLLVRGLFLKMVIADDLGGYVDQMWDSFAARGAGGLKTLALAYLFSMQIFADFAGYSSIARGLAYFLGFRLPLNFNAPYIAASFKEFWTRWHITLSTWLKDYLYISLGGNRRGRVQTYVNLLLVMFLGGLWHGAALTFIVWGVIHGTALAVERACGLHTDSARRPSWVRALQFAAVQFTVLIAWIFFRATSLDQAMHMVGDIFGPWRLGGAPRFPVEPLLLTLPVWGLHLRTKINEWRRRDRLHWMEQPVNMAVMVYLILTCVGPENEFIYFQF